ncbi:MAG: hypothetical protein RSA86_06740, partial [Christensenellaceae bacterium]
KQVVARWRRIPWTSVAHGCMDSFGDLLVDGEKKNEKVTKCMDSFGDLLVDGTEMKRVDGK